MSLLGSWAREAARESGYILLFVSLEASAQTAQSWGSRQVMEV